MDIILASMDYAQFILLMKIMRYRSKQESAAEEKAAAAGAKDTKKDDEEDHGAAAKDVGLAKADEKESTSIETDEEKQPSPASAKE